MNTMKNFICYSFECDILPFFKTYSETYIPVKCGTYDTDKIVLSDRIGDSISQYNALVNEMTLIWSLGKNIEVFGDPEYIGISHYRRYLDLSKSTVDKNKIICNYGVTTYSLYQLYSIYHNIDDLNLFISIFIKHFPELRKNIMEYFSQSRMYMCNLFVMHREIFRHYFSFIEKCIKICIDEIRPQLNFDTRDKYQQRVLSFILERMTGFWIWNFWQNKNMPIEKVPIIMDNSIQSIYKRPNK